MSTSSARAKAARTVIVGLAFAASIRCTYRASSDAAAARASWVRPRCCRWRRTLAARCITSGGLDTPTACADTDYTNTLALSYISGMHIAPMTFSFPEHAQTRHVLHTLRCVLHDAVEQGHSPELARRNKAACEDLHALGPSGVADLLGHVLARESKISEARFLLESNWVVRMLQAIDVMDGITMQTATGFNVFRSAFRELEIQLRMIELDHTP